MNEIASQIEGLHRLAERHRLRAQDAIVDTMIEASFKASAPIEQFSQWQLVAQGVIATYLIAHAESMREVLTSNGYLACAGVLVLSAIFGNFSKSQAVLLRAGTESYGALIEGLDRAYAEAEADEDNLESLANQVGITIDVDVRMNEVLLKFYEPLPWWVRWRVGRIQQKRADKWYLKFLDRIRRFNAQSLSAVAQTATFLIFFGVALGFASLSV